MKKHVIGFMIVLLILTLVGTGAWLVIRYNNAKTLYQVSCDFAFSEDSKTLTKKIENAQSLYDAQISGETRLMVLYEINLKINSFEKDLISYLQMSDIKPAKTKELNKKYSSLSSHRKELIKNYDEYIIRMNGNLIADNSAIQNLYKNLFARTVSYLQKYNSCFASISQHVFNKVYRAETIKPQLYSLYSLGVTNLLSSISNSSFTYNALTTIDRLNSGIELENGTLKIKTSVDGGEFSSDARNFKQYFTECDKSNFISNFEDYYSSYVNPTVETSKEKLAMYYAKRILEI